ncbi:MAG: GNAT family N-acetyltransferase [Thermoanaerobaculia bacterium]
MRGIGRNEAYAARSPAEADAPALATLWRRSIEELCHADHGGRRDIIESWCARKTPERLCSDFADPSLLWLVAETPGGRLAGVGVLHRDGTILGLYVSPDEVGRGVGSELLAALLREATDLGHQRVHLESTATGHAFYAAHGFRDSGAPVVRLGSVRAFPMVMELPRSGPGTERRFSRSGPRGRT